MAQRRRFKGKLIGALVGSLAGPMGTALGGLFGHLFDKAEEEQQALGSLRPADRASPAQLEFLSSLIALSVAVAEAGGEACETQVANLKGFLRDTFSYDREDRRVLEAIVDECFRRRRDLEVASLCRAYAGISSPAGRLLLLRLLFQITTAARRAPGARQLALIRSIGLRLGVEAAALRGLEAEFLATEGGATLGGGSAGGAPGGEALSRAQAYGVLGITPEAPDEAVRSRYRRMAAQAHPDRVANLGEELVACAEEKFKLIAEAYELIGRERGWKPGSP